MNHLKKSDEECVKDRCQRNEIANSSSDIIVSLISFIISVLLLIIFVKYGKPLKIDAETLILIMIENCEINDQEDAADPRKTHAKNM